MPPSATSVTQGSPWAALAALCVAEGVPKAKGKPQCLFHLEGGEARVIAKAEVGFMSGAGSTLRS